MSIFEQRAQDKYGCSYSQLTDEQRIWVDVWCDDMLYEACVHSEPEEGGCYDN